MIKKQAGSDAWNQTKGGRKKKVAVLGSGNGGCAAAADWSLAGHEVRIFDFPEFTEQISAVSQKGGVTITGELEGFAPVHYAGHSIEETIRGAELILAIWPAYSTEPFANAVKDLITRGPGVHRLPRLCGRCPDHQKNLQHQRERQRRLRGRNRYPALRLPYERAW